MNTKLKLLILVTGSLLILSVNANAQTCKTTTIASTTSHLVGNTDGTVSDTKTDLTWKRCAEGQTWDGATSTCTASPPRYNWQEALELAENAGPDWRLPNVKELTSIVEQQCINPSLNLTAFPNNIVTGHYWSSSTSAYWSHAAWFVNFGAGYHNFGAKNAGNHVRLVRD